MADDKDPTVRHIKGGAPEYPEGTHPTKPVSEQTWGPNRFSYSDLDDDQKPDPTSVISQVEPDPIEEENQKVLREGAQQGAERAQQERQEQQAQAQAEPAGRKARQS